MKENVKIQISQRTRNRENLKTPLRQKENVKTLVIQRNRNNEHVKTLMRPRRITLKLLTQRAPPPPLYVRQQFKTIKMDILT